MQNASRLYPSLAPKSQIPPASPSKIATHALSKLAHALPSGISRLTTSTEQDTHHLFPSLSTNGASNTGSRRHAPRISSLPTLPTIEDIPLTLDTTAEYAIIISMYEVHNDRIFDLLGNNNSTSKNQPHTNNNSASTLKRRPLLFKPTELSPDRKVVAGLKKVICSDYEEALLVLETGLQERRVAGTGTNATSSRSHGFFCVEVKKRRRGGGSTGVPGPWTSSTLTIVDLAGSERARTAKTAGATLAEAGKINESLMYLGQCMQMQSDNASSGVANSSTTTPNLVPFRQCKLTELLFSNSLASSSQPQQQNGIPPPQKLPPQKAIMIVTADPLGDFNATSQILRYSALAREVTVPRIPSVTSTILSSALARPCSSGSSRPTTPSAELDVALSELARMREELEIVRLRLAEETQRRVEAERSWKVAESRMEGLEVEVREEVWGEMEGRLEMEMRRWRVARETEMEMLDMRLDRKLEILSRGLGKENEEPSFVEDVEGEDEDVRLMEVEEENVRLKAEMKRMLERGEEEEERLRSPSKKMRVLKSRKWEGSGMGLE